MENIKNYFTKCSNSFGKESRVDGLLGFLRCRDPGTANLPDQSPKKKLKNKKRRYGILAILV